MHRSHTPPVHIHRLLFAGQHHSRALYPQIHLLSSSPSSSCTSHPRARMSDEKEVAAQVDTGKKEVDKLVSTSASTTHAFINIVGNLPKALSAALAIPVPKDEKLKLTLTQSVSGVLSAVKEAEIAKTIEGMSQEERLNAMKFVYRGMATGQNCTQLLKWHSALYDKDGTGSIMRVLVDRNL